MHTQYTSVYVCVCACVLCIKMCWLDSDWNKKIVARADTTDLQRIKILNKNNFM